jgi:hypothetical protein
MLKLKVKVRLKPSLRSRVTKFGLARRNISGVPGNGSETQPIYSADLKSKESN